VSIQLEDREVHSKLFEFCLESVCIVANFHPSSKSRKQNNSKLYNQSNSFSFITNAA